MKLKLNSVFKDKYSLQLYGVVGEQGKDFLCYKLYSGDKPFPVDKEIVDSKIFDKNYSLCW